MVLRRQADQKYGRYADLYHKVEAESPQLNTPLFCFVSGILELVSSGVVYFRFFQSIAVAEAITTAAPVL